MANPEDKTTPVLESRQPIELINGDWKPSSPQETERTGIRGMYISTEDIVPHRARVSFYDVFSDGRVQVTSMDRVFKDSRYVTEPPYLQYDDGVDATVEDGPQGPILKYERVKKTEQV